jgi:hypothetical protein
MPYLLKIYEVFNENQHGSQPVLKKKKAKHIPKDVSLLCNQVLDARNLDAVNLRNR